MISRIERPPEVRPDLSNLGEVDAYFAAHGPNPAFLRGFHVVMSTLCAPRTVFASGAPEKIEDHLRSGEPGMIAMVHHSWFDPFNTAASVHEEPPLQAIQGNTIIPARLGDFNNPVFGPILVGAGAKPVYREKDLRRYYHGQGLSEAEVDAELAAMNEDRLNSNRKLQEAQIQKVDEGFIYASFVEGGRNRDDPTKVQPIRNGMKAVLEAIDSPETTKVICVGYDYGGGKIMKRYLTPTVYIDLMDAAPVKDFNERLAGTLQDCINGAIANRTDGTRLSPLTKAGLMGAALGGTAIARKLTSR